MKNFYNFILGVVIKRYFTGSATNIEKSLEHNLEHVFSNTYCNKLYTFIYIYTVKIQSKISIFFRNSPLLASEKVEEVIFHKE